MRVNLFISFAEEDREQLESFRALAKNSNHRLRFRDRSQLEPVLDKRRKPIRQPPRHPASKPIRDHLHPLLDRATRLTVLVGETTHESEWVDWEIRTFFDKKRKLQGNVERRLIAMRLRGHRKAKLPKAVLELGIQRINWNPDAFAEWLDTDLNSWVFVTHYSRNWRLALPSLNSSSLSLVAWSGHQNTSGNVFSKVLPFERNGGQFRMKRLFCRYSIDPSIDFWSFVLHNMKL